MTKSHKIGLDFFCGEISTPFTHSSSFLFFVFNELFYFWKFVKFHQHTSPSLSASLSLSFTFLLSLYFKMRLEYPYRFRLRLKYKFSLRSKKSSFNHGNPNEMNEIKPETIRFIKKSKYCPTNSEIKYFQHTLNK